MPCLILCMWQQEGEEQSSWTKERAAPVCRVDMAQPFARRTKDGRRDSLQQLQPFAVRGTRSAVLMELDKKRSLSAEFFSDKRPLALRALGPGAEGKELGNDASRQPSTAAASRASAAQLLMADAKEAPRGASRLTAAAVDIDAAVKMPAAVGGKAAFLGSAERPPSSMIATAAEPASSTVEAATRLRAPPTGNAEQLNAEQLPQAAQPRPAELLPDKRPVALQALAPGADGRESDDDTSRQPSTIAASRASAARLLMMGAAGTPRGASRLIGATLHADVGLSGNTPALVGCKAGFLGIAEQQPSSITAAAAELSEPVSSSGETATGCKALPTGDVEQLVAKQLPQEAQSRSTESFSDKRLVASRDPGPRAQGKDSEGDAPRQPSTTAASRVIAARLLMTGAAGTPRGVSTLTGTAVDADTALSSSPLAAVACNPAFVGSAEQQLSSMTAASAELREPVSNSREAATGCRALPTGGSEQLVAKQLPQEAQSRSTESFSDKRLVASRDAGPRAQGKDSEDDASRQPSTTAASRVIAARLLMTGATGTPKGASSLAGAGVDADVALSINTPAAVDCNPAVSQSAEQRPRSMTTAAAELSEPVSGSVEAATGVRASNSSDAEQNPGESQEAGQGSFGWRSIRGSIRGSFLEAGSHFKKRRWTLLLVTPTSHLHIHEILSCIAYELSESSTLARQALCEFVSPNSTKGAPARCNEPSSDARIATDLNDDFWKLLLFAAPIILGFLIHGNPSFCLAQMGNKGEDRRFSMPIRRVQKRLTNDIVLRDRRWGSIFGKTVLPQRQVGSLASTQRTASLVQKT